MAWCASFSWKEIGVFVFICFCVIELGNNPIFIESHMKTRAWSVLLAVMLCVCPLTVTGQERVRSPVVLPHVQARGVEQPPVGRPLAPLPSTTSRQQKLRRDASRTTFIVMTAVLIVSTGIAMRPANSETEEEVMRSIRPQMAFSSLIGGLTSIAAMSAGLELGNGWVVGASGLSYAAVIAYPFYLRYQSLETIEIPEQPVQQQQEPPPGCCVLCGAGQSACGNGCIPDGEFCSTASGCACG